MVTKLTPEESGLLSRAVHSEQGYYRIEEAVQAIVDGREPMPPTGQERHTQPVGDLARRMWGGEIGLRRRALAARDAAALLDKDDPHAIALRGKAKGLDEGADVLDALQEGRNLPPKSRDTPPPTEGAPS